jgi:hypothetical protein
MPEKHLTSPSPDDEARQIKTKLLNAQSETPKSRLEFAHSVLSDYHGVYFAPPL